MPPIVMRLPCIEIWEVLLGNDTIKFHRPLVIVPNKIADDSNESDDIEYWEADLPELNISSFGRDREELLRSVQDDIRVMWKTFVQQNDSKLDPAALAIKHNYFDLAEVMQSYSVT